MRSILVFLSHLQLLVSLLEALFEFVPAILQSVCGNQALVKKTRIRTMAGPRSSFMWNPSLGSNVPLLEGSNLPDYGAYTQSAAWLGIRRLRDIEGAGKIVYRSDGVRHWPNNVSDEKFLSLVPGSADGSLTPMQRLNCLEGQVSLLYHVALYEQTHHVNILSGWQSWKMDFLRFFMGSVTTEEMKKFQEEAATIDREGRWHGTFASRKGKKLTYELRHNTRNKQHLGPDNELPLELLQREMRWLDMSPLTAFSLLAGNSKARYRIIVKLVDVDFSDLNKLDFDVYVAAWQGHSRMADSLSETALGEVLTLERCRQLGYIFHSAFAKDYQSIQSQGMLRSSVKEQGQSGRLAIHFVYGGGTEAPRQGTLIWEGNDRFYVNLDYETLYADGQALHFTPNGVVLAYFDVAPKYLTHHWRPSYEKDPGGRRWDKRRENVGSPTEGQASASSSSGGFPKGKGPTEQTEKGSSPKGEVPKVTVNELRRLIEEEETRNLRAAKTMEMGRAIPFERGVEVEGRVDTGKVRIEKMQSAFDRLNANPWFLYEQGHLKLRNSMGRRVRTDLGDHPARCTPWASLTGLSGNDWATSDQLSGGAVLSVATL